MTQLANELEHRLGGVERRLAAGIAIPGEASIAHLQVFQTIYNAVVLGLHELLVEELVESRHAQRLAVGLIDPWRGKQRANLQVAVACEHRHQRGVFLIHLPVVDSLFDAWLRLGDALCQRDGKEAVGKRGGNVVVVAEDGGQCLNAVPHGVVAVLQCHAGITGKLWQPGRERWGSGVDVERLRLNHWRDRGQHRNHHLLAVAKVACGGFHPEANEWNSVGHSPVNSHGAGAAGSNVLLEGLALYHITRARVEQLDDGVAGEGSVGRVLQACRQLCLVALTQEAWQARLHHHGFAGEHLAVEFVGQEVAIVGYRLDNPSGVEIRRLKFQ